MLKMDQYIDLIIPRGSNEFVRYIMDNSRIPVLGHADGICHCYVDEADLEMAARIVVDSKTQYVAVCNATETLLVHEKSPGLFAPLKDLLDKKQVELTGCPRTREIDADPATEEDWGTEYLDYKLSIKVVGDVDEAINHINHYGSGRTDSIIRATRTTPPGSWTWLIPAMFSELFHPFQRRIPLRLWRGSGISTNKIHARGPVGLEGLVIYKYKLIGNGHIVAEYSNREKTFKHNKLGKEFPL